MKTIEYLETIEINGYRDFRCSADKCLDHCCHSWTVIIDKPTYDKYVEMGYSDYIVPHNDLYRIKLDENGLCPFLNEEALCSLQKKHGEEILSDTCTIYPKSIGMYNNHLEFSLSASCPVVASNIIFSNEQLFFDVGKGTNVKKDLLLGHRIKTKFSEELCFVIRAISVTILQEQKAPIWKRLIYIGLMINALNVEKEVSNEKLNKILDSYENNINEESILKSMDDLPVDNEFRINSLVAFLELIYSFCMEYTASEKTKNKAFIERINKKQTEFADLSAISLNEYWNKLMPSFIEENPLIFENYLVYEMFHSKFPADYETPHLSYSAIVFKFVLLQLFTAYIYNDKEKLTREDMLNAMYFFNKKMDHSVEIPLKFQEILGGIDKVPLSSLVHLVR